MNSVSHWTRSRVLLAVPILLVVFAASISAQVQTQATTTSGTPTKQVKIESGEVVAVKGNDLFVKMQMVPSATFPMCPRAPKLR